MKALPRPGSLYLDLPVHQSHQAFGDGHAQACARSLLIAKTHFPGIGLIEVLQKGGRHPDARVCHDELIGDIFPLVHLQDGKGDRPPAGVNLKELDSRLLRICCNRKGSPSRWLSFSSKWVSRACFGLRLEVESRQALLYAGAQVELIVLQYHFALFHAGHIQICR